MNSDLNEYQHQLGTKILQLLGVDLEKRDILSFNLQISWNDGTALLTTQEVVKNPDGTVARFPDGSLEIRTCGDSLSVPPTDASVAFKCTVNRPQMDAAQIRELERRLREFYKAPVNLNGPSHGLIWNEVQLPQPGDPYPVCPDCRGTRLYQPLTGPAEPCKTCCGKSES